MNNIIRYLTIAIFWGGGGGVALLGLAGEVRAQGSSCPLAQADWNTYEPYICDVASPADGATETVTWTLTFSEPVTGVGWDDFQTDNTNDEVPGSSPTRKYGLGSVGEKITGNGTNYKVTMEWECTTSDNDCHHNETVMMTGTCPPTGGDVCTTSYESSGRTDRYVGEVWLELYSDAEFNEVNKTILPQTSTTHTTISKASTKVSVN